MPRSSRRSAAHLGRTRKIDTLQDFMESIHNKLHAKPSTIQHADYSSGTQTAQRAAVTEITNEQRHNFAMTNSLDKRFNTVTRSIIEETQFYGS